MSIKLRSPLTDQLSHLLEGSSRNRDRKRKIRKRAQLMAVFEPIDHKVSFNHCISLVKVVFKDIQSLNDSLR